MPPRKRVAPASDAEPQTVTQQVTDEGEKPGRKQRTPRTFPATSFMEALPLALAIQQHASGQRVRRITLLENMKRSAESSTSRQLITTSGQYGITKGAYNAEFLELTEAGNLASADDVLGRPKLAARLELAIAKIPAFNALYERFQNVRVPNQTVLRDAAIEDGTPQDQADQCVEIFMANARDLGLVKTMAGAERFLTFEHLLGEAEPADGASATTAISRQPGSTPPNGTATTPSRLTLEKVLADSGNLSDVCFVISPIGTDESVQRKHADLVFGSIVEPALEGLSLRVVRADKIGKPGMITRQVAEHLVRSPLVIADLSFGNPNVFYELALRHASRRPVIQLVRTGDALPFDVNQFRTVFMDMTDIYTLVPQLDSIRSEVTRHCRAALESEGPVDSPLSLFFPTFWDEILKP
jgi:hypothetical protein